MQDMEPMGTWGLAPTMLWQISLYYSKQVEEIMPIPLLFTPSDFLAFLRPCYLMSEKDRTQSKVFKLIWFLLWYSFQRKRKTGMIINFLKSNWIVNIRKIDLMAISNIVSLKAKNILL